MANKYIIEGAAFNGNGTSSAEATVAGGVGAWNTITYFEGATPAYGSIAAGDTVYIRSKTAAGADITRTLTAALTVGSANATVADHVRWVLDGGTVWPGVSGSLTFTGTSFNSTLRAYNSLYAEIRGAWVYRPTSLSATAGFIFLQDACEVKHLLFDGSLQTSNGTYVQGSSGRCRLVSCDFITNRRQAGFGAILGSDYVSLTVEDPAIEVLSVQPNQIFKPGNLGGSIEVFGGRIYGAGATSGTSVAIITGSTAGIRFIGTDIPKEMDIVLGGTSYGNNGILEAIGLDGGVGAVFSDWRTGTIDSRSDGFYPTLNAFLPTTTQTPWSWKVWPNKTTRNIPFKVTSTKLYTGDAGVKTLTCNFLVADSILGADTESTWLEVQYIDDATGLRKRIDTRSIDGLPLEVSTASWSATTYGAVNLLKRQIQVTTPTAVKKDTLVIATLRSFVTAVSANDLMFVCPDVVMV